ncbi:hypothetical protein Tco_0691676 [Tanacetum coccineum]
MKAITTPQYGVCLLWTLRFLQNPSPKKVVERETEETTDKEQTNFQGSTAQIPPPVIPISILEPDVPKTLPKTTPIPESDVPKSLPKPNIPYPSRRDDIEILLHHDPSTPMKSVASILEGFIDDPLFEENDDLFDLECKTNDWKRILYDATIDKAKCFDPGGDNDEIDAFLAIEVPMYIEEGYYDSEGDVIYLESFLDDMPPKSSPEWGGKINVEIDNSFIFVTQTFLPYLTYLEVSPLLSSAENEDIIFDPGIST